MFRTDYSADSDLVLSMIKPVTTAQTEAASAERVSGIATPGTYRTQNSATQTAAARTEAKKVNIAILLLDVRMKDAVMTNIESGKSPKNATDAYRCMGLLFSEKTPIAVNAKQSMRNKSAPARPAEVPLEKEKSPTAKAIASIPPVISPKLNKIAVGFGITPRSLSALSVQLKLGAYAIDSNMQLNATMGVSIPQIPDIFNSECLSRFNMHPP
jgi:hypothetical protein